MIARFMFFYKPGVTLGPSRAQHQRPRTPSPPATPGPLASIGASTLVSHSLQQSHSRCAPEPTWQTRLTPHAARMRAWPLPPAHQHPTQRPLSPLLHGPRRGLPPPARAHPASDTLAPLLSPFPRSLAHPARTRRSPDALTPPGRQPRDARPAADQPAPRVSPLFPLPSRLRSAPDIPGELAGIIIPLRPAEIPGSLL